MIYLRMLELKKNQNISQTIDHNIDYNEPREIPEMKNSRYENPELKNSRFDYKYDTLEQGLH